MSVHRARTHQAFLYHVASSVIRWKIERIKLLNWFDCYNNFWKLQSRAHEEIPLVTLARQANNYKKYLVQLWINIVFPIAIIGVVKIFKNLSKATWFSQIKGEQDDYMLKYVP